MVKTRVIKLRGIEGPNVGDQIAFYAFHSFLRRLRNNNLEIRMRAPLARNEVSLLSS